MVSFLIYLLLFAGIIFLIGSFFIYKELKNAQEKEIIEEKKVCPADLTEKEKNKKINEILEVENGEIIKREVKDDGYLYITIKTTNIKKLKSSLITSISISFILISLFILLNTAHNKDVKKYKTEHYSKYEYLIGEKYTYEIAQELGGNVETLPGTDNKKWIAYFPKTNITIIEDKKTGIIQKVIKGRKE